MTVNGNIDPNLVDFLDYDNASPTELMAEELATQDSSLQWDLVEKRKAMGLTVETVAERMGMSVARVTEFEAYWYDPKQSEMRRYALAVHAVIQHKLIDGDEFLAQKK